MSVSCSDEATKPRKCLLIALAKQLNKKNIFSDLRPKNPPRHPAHPFLRSMLDTRKTIYPFP